MVMIRWFSRRGGGLHGFEVRLFVVYLRRLLVAMLDMSKIRMQRQSLVLAIIDGGEDQLTMSACFFHTVMKASVSQIAHHVKHGRGQPVTTSCEALV